MNIEKICGIPGLCIMLSVGCAGPHNGSIEHPDGLIATPKDAKPILAPLLSAHDQSSDRFRSVGRLNGTIGTGRTCTATLVAGVENPPPQSPALLLTAGHCGGGQTGDNEVVVDQPMGDGWFFTPSYFHDNTDEHRLIPIVQILYSSMKSTDLAILQLGVSYGEMKDYGFKPVKLKAFSLDIPAIESAHIPVGLFVDRYLRHSICKIRPPAAVLESAETAQYPWFWPSSIPSDCIGVYGGSSGAPVFIKDGSEISGVISTGRDEEISGCGFNRPCEVKDGQPVVQPSTTYIASIQPLIDAFKADGTFESSALDEGTGIALDVVGTWITPSQKKGGGRQQVPARWSIHINESHELIRYKYGFADQVRCDDPSGYSPEESSAKQALLELPMPNAVGIYALCAVGRRNSSAQWQPFSQATIKLRQIQ
jgi:hypothetical protein